MIRINKILLYSFVLLFWACSSENGSENKHDNLSSDTNDIITTDSVVSTKVAKEEKRDTVFFLARGSNNLYGYKDSIGNWLIDPQYKLAGNFGEKLAPVWWNGNWHLINKKGVSIRKMTKLKPIVLHNELSGEQTIMDLTERTLPVEFPDGKKGFLNMLSGKVSRKYDDVYSFSEGLAAVSFKFKWGIVNHQDKWIVKPTYERVYPFHSGRARAIHQGNYGYLNKSGQVAIPLRFKSGHQFSEGIAFVSLTDNYMNLFMIDTLGNKISDKIFEEVYNFGFKNGEAEVFYNGKCIVIDKTGKKIRDSKNGCQEGC